MPSRYPPARETALSVCMYVRRRSGLISASEICEAISPTSCASSSLSGSEAESEATHAIERLRAAVRDEPSSAKST